MTTEATMMNRDAPQAKPGPAGPTARYENITPARARQMLEQNTHNRNIRSKHVAAMAADMLRGEFDDNGETIKLAHDGTVIDGQHRLLAVVKSGVTLRMLVVTGLPLSAQETVDVGSKRSFGDVLTRREEKNTATLAATVRRVALWERGCRGPALNSGTATVKDMLAVLEIYPEVRDTVSKANNIRRVVPLSAATLGLTHHLFSHIDKADCDDFFTKLCDGSMLEPTDPVFVLRRTIMLSQTTRHRLNEGVATAYVIKAWNAYREGRPITLLSWKSGGASPEPFPEPK